MLTNKDILRRLRYALELDDAHTARFLSTAQEPVTEEQARTLLDKTSDDECPSSWLGRFLDALVLERRGPRDPNAPPLPPAPDKLTNNMVLKKLRIALEYKEQDMLDTLTRGGMEFSSAELTALFRKPGHKHFRPCGDQLLRVFLTGMAERLRQATSSD